MYSAYAEKMSAQACTKISSIKETESRLSLMCSSIFNSFSNFLQSFLHACVNIVLFFFEDYKLCRINKIKL